MWFVQDNSGLSKCDPSVPYSCLERSSCLQLCPSCPQRIIKVSLDTLNVFEWIFSVVTNWNDSCLLLMTFRAGAHRRTAFFLFQTIMCLITPHQNGSLAHGKYFPVLERRWWVRWSVWTDVNLIQQVLSSSFRQAQTGVHFVAVDTYAGVFYQVNFFKVSLKPETGLLSPSENQIGSFPGEPETRPTKS